jgi:lipopolysaccharide export system protein LptC
MQHGRVLRVAQGARQTVRATVQPAAGYSRLVWLLKRSLWVMIALVMVAVIWVAADNTGDRGARMVFSQNGEAVDLSKNIMEQPHYQGVDSNNQPYTVTARRATQREDETVFLEEVTADMLQNNGQWMALKSNEGIYDDTKKILNLSGKINMFAADGFEFRTEEAQIDLNTGIATGNVHIEGQGAPGTLTADSFSADNNTKVIRFNGSVKMTLYPR